MRKVILYIAMSVDGYITDQDGGVAWLTGEDEEHPYKGSYPSFIKTVDTVVMGHTTYRAVTETLSPESWPYRGLKTYVLTHQTMDDLKNIFFTDRPLAELIGELKQAEGKDIWICGGAETANQMLAADLIDRYHITVIPKITGGGLKLFNENNPVIDLRLISLYSENGMTDLIYERR